MTKRTMRRSAAAKPKDTPARPADGEECTTGELAFEVPGLDGDSAGPANSDSAAAQRPSAAVEIEAAACLPNQECPFSDKCRGRLHAFNQINTTEERDGKRVTIRKQQLRCTKCGRMPSGYRMIGGPRQIADVAVFNRRKGTVDR